MGFVIVQVGWQGDLTVTDRNIVPFLPIARYPSGSSIVGPAVEEFIFNDEEVVSEASLTYAVVALMPGLATFSVRARQGAPRVPIEEPDWSFTNERQIRVNRPSGFDGGAIYELLYLAKDPISRAWAPPATSRARRRTQKSGSEVRGMELTWFPHC